jgi:hypothetical protein
MEETATDVASSVAIMLGRLDAIAEVEHQIRFLSLNTSIHCSRLGDDGNALRVIAQELRELAQQTVAAAGAIMSGLSEAETLAQSLADGRSHGIGDRIAALEGDAEVTIGLFEAVVSRLHDHAAAMTASGPRTVRQLEAAAGSVSGQLEFVEDWRDARMEILSLALFDAEALDISVIDTNLIAGLRARYTMDSERCVHDALLGPPADAQPTAGAASTAEAELDDIFF